MSDTWLNWRFGEYHLQVGKWFIRWSWNWAHRKDLRPNGWKWFERY